MNLNEFYNSLLNINPTGNIDTVKNIVAVEKNKLTNINKDFQGFCKYMADQISCQLDLCHIKNYLVDLNSFGIDHVILIAEYSIENKINRVLIDPTFIQFTKKDNLKLLTLKEWPSEILNKELVDELNNSGVINLDDKVFNNYLNAFGIKEYINLEDYLLELNLNKKL